MKTTLTAAALGIAIIATPAVAAPEAGDSMKIEYNDLNLSTAEGQERLNQRIDRAARKLCRADEPRTGTRMPSSEAQTCLAKAKASAERQMATITGTGRLGG
jgi:UrcA family protein